MKKTIGIIGGMGPLATADLFRKIILATDADSDRAHIRILIDNNTNIPDRTAAILHGGESPMEQLVASAEILERAGADFLIMPCNTAHYFHAQLQARTSLPVLNMLALTADHLASRGFTKVGLLATDGTIATGIYETLLHGRGIDIVKPDVNQQRLVMSLIYDDIKSGHQRTDPDHLRQMLCALQHEGAQTFVLGCTELPIAFERDTLGVPTVDPTNVLARSAVEFAGYPLRSCN